MSTSSAPQDLQALVEGGARLLQALRPVWREVSRALPRGKGRKYLAFAVGLVGVAIAGTYLVSSVRRPAAERPRDSAPE